MIPSDTCLFTLTRMLKLTGKTVTIDVMNTCRQAVKGNCGLFAVACAETILSGKDPCNVVYEESVMRQHLINCFSDCHLTPFPITNYKTNRRQIVRSKTYPLYCLCRSVYTRSSTMIQCNSCREWFHQVCVGMRDISFDTYSQPEQPYLCPSCVTKTFAPSNEGNRDDNSIHVTSPNQHQLPHNKSEFWVCVANTRRAADWLRDNREKFRGEIRVPVAASESDEQLATTMQEFDGDNIKDLAIFLFSNADDLTLFDDLTRNELKTAVCVGLLPSGRRGSCELD